MKLLDALLLMSVAGSLVSIPALLLCQFARRLPARWIMWTHGAALALFLAPLAPAVCRLAPLLRGLAAQPVSSWLIDWPMPAEGSPTAVWESLEVVLPAVNWVGVLAALPWLWLAGVLFRALRQMQRGRRFAGILREGSYPLSDPEISGSCKAICLEMGIGADVALRICPWTATPMLAGLRRPVLYLPQQAYSKNQWELVLRHELTHLVRRDLWTKWLAQLACTLHWFNPAAHLLAKTLDRTIELACDADMVRHLSPQERLRYGQVILDSVGGVQAQDMGLRATLCADTHSIKRRITLMLNAKPIKGKKRAIFVLALLLAVALCTGASAAVPFSLEDIYTQSQKSGDEMLPSIHVDHDSVPALKSPITDSAYGPFTYPGHDGLDYVSPEGTPIFAAAAGTVLYASGEDEGYGNCVIVDHGNGYATLYAHCHELFAQEGKSVKAGEQIASVGSTGSSTGNHLHFELRLSGEPVDATAFLR